MPVNMFDRSVALGFAQAREVARKNARIFYTASLLLPRGKQDNAYAIYAVCRESDEAVDDLKFTDRQERLEAVKREVALAYAGEPLESDLLKAFRHAVENTRIPRGYFDELLEGMGMDLIKSRYANFQELSVYCYKVAGVIGLILLKVFDCHNPEAEKYAVDLGFAMQTTNIIRDIKEDWERGRIYLPQDEMERYGVQEKDIEQGLCGYEFKRLLEFQAERARSYYERSLPGISFIADRRLRCVVRAMHKMYSSILDGIEQAGFDVFSGQFRLSEARKAGIIVESLIKG